MGGLKFQAVDGGDLEDVTVQDITMHDVAAPFSFRRGNRGFDYGFEQVQRPRPVGRVRNVLVSRVRAVVATDAALRDGHTTSIAGIPGYPVQDVTLEDVHIVFPGGGTLDDARRPRIPERESAYPEHSMFGVLPAHGLYVRHADRVALRNVRFDLATPDARPALLCEDVENVELTGFRAGITGGEPLVRLRGTRGALLQNCRPTGGVHSFLSVDGADSATIAVLRNDLRDVAVPITGADGFAGGVTEAGNLR